MQCRQKTKSKEPLCQALLANFVGIPPIRTDHSSSIKRIVLHNEIVYHPFRGENGIIGGTSKFNLR